MYAHCLQSQAREGMEAGLSGAMQVACVALVHPLREQRISVASGRPERQTVQQTARKDEEARGVG